MRPGNDRGAKKYDGVVDRSEFLEDSERTSM